MAEDAENTCCAAWKKKHSKLLEKYSKLEELKNKFRDCTSLVNQRYDVIEKENQSLKHELGNLKAQADRWKDEKAQEYSVRFDLENEISRLKNEIQPLQQNGISASNESGRQLQERLDVSELEINQLKELVEKERRRADLEQKNADMERKKANGAVKKLEAGKNMVSEVQKAVDINRKKAEENKVLYERLKLENDAVKSKLCLEISKCEAANKKVEDEKQHTIKERKMADSAVFKAEEQRKLAETNLKKAIAEKDRADNLDQKLKKEKRRTEKLEEELREYLCSRKLAETRIDLSNASIESVLRNDGGARIAKSEALMSQGIENMVKEKDQFSFREKKCTDSEVKKVVKHKKTTEVHKRKAVEAQYHVEQLSRELENCKQRLEELQKRQISGGTHVVNPAVREKSNSSDRATVKLLKKQKKLEKMLVKHAKEVTKVDVRNSLLHQELYHTKKRFHQFQQRLDLLDFCFVHGGDAIHELEKAGDETFTKEKFYTDGYLKQLVSGIDSRLNPLHRGSYRKMSKSSALNSSTTSFSYLPLMGSQERGAFSVTTSAKPAEDVSNLKSSLSKLSCEGKVWYGENMVVNAEKSTQSPIKGNADISRIRDWDKRKILGALESMNKLYSKGQKLHEQMSKQLSVLHDILSDRKDVSTEQNLPENFCAEQARPTKWRKTSCEETKIIHSLHNSNGRKDILDSDIKNSIVGRKASSPGLDVRKCDQCLKDGIDNYLESTKCAHGEFDEMPIHDYMKLLELDNSADERSYGIAIARPISPTLPEITFLGIEAIDTDDAGMSVKDNLAPTSGFNTFDMEKNCKHPENLCVEHESGACYCHNQVLGGKLGTPNVNGSKSGRRHFSRESSIASIPGAFPNYFVYSLENKDNGSISRILQAIIRCKPQCTPLHSADVFLQLTLLSLEKAEDLSSKEKVCVFFSIIMLGISEIEMKNLANFLKCDLVRSLDSITLHICSALSDMVVRGIFMESCDLFDLLTLVEDFLLQRKALMCGDLSSEAPVIGSSKIKLVVNGNTVILSEQAALTYQLVAGGCLLASLCLAMDHIGFLCATSCELFAMPKSDPAVVLTILHSFAHLCGSRYFNLQPYSLAMAVVKSLVMVLEKQASSSNHASTFSSMVEMPSKTWSCCTNCLFSEGVVSMEVLTSSLLENLQKNSKSCSLPQDSLELMNSMVPTVLSNEEIIKDDSGLSRAVPLIGTSNESLCNFVDILSLVEIIAHFMRWEWTFDHIIGGLLEILESCAMMTFYAAIIVLLNQLGRLGVYSNGYEDAGVKKLRDCLFAFLCESSSRNLSIPVQFAVVTALLGLIPVSFEELCAIESQPNLSQESIPADLIRKWFSLLSKEQQLSFRLHQTTGKTKS